MAQTPDLMDKIVALCKRRGFIFQSSEIYGGIGGFWDYGPLGVELKRNLKDVWWNDMVGNPPPGPDGREYQMVGLDCAIIMNPKVWEASGHVGGFSDPLIDDTETKQRFRADQLCGCWGHEGEPPLGTLLRSVRDMVKPGGELIDVWMPFATIIANSPSEAASEVQRNPKAIKPWKITGEFRASLGEESYLAEAVGPKGLRGWIEVCEVGAELLEGFADRIPSPFTGKAGALTKPRQFNLMLKTHIGAMEDSSSVAYLRPETAQGIFVNFKNVLDSTRVKLPFGIAQVGKSFRNEINPRNYTFRSREFEQYEIEFFCHPSEADVWYQFWRSVRHQWYVKLGLRSEKLRLREHEPSELAHYAKGCADVEYDFPFGLSELEGIANRTDFDLKAHIEHSGKDLSYFDDQRKERFVPYVIEPSGGVDRSVLAFITEAYTFDESRASPEFMKFHPRLAPIKAAVFPLVAKDGMPEIAEPIWRDIRKHYPCQYDAKQSIGKRYARMDEAGTPFCFTIDGQTKEDGTVTVRDRDDASQVRIDKTRCLEYLREKLAL
ncbi:MAG TPA: glycine--tRNA ligase [Phycisphaerae bacterium]|nr:glycine--tRNA ligase [Phycisphaerae bacterium]HNU45126.1 glycine--tRNA ligase [Phycisphaerae bacterium]